jgi:glyoxylase-like metal-dependent hydrolase (beta-lactamase superfamily II)
MITGDVFHHLLQVLYPDWNFPKNSDAQEARVSRRRVFDEAAASGALVFPGHVGAPFAGHIEKTGGSYKPRF